MLRPLALLFLNIKQPLHLAICLDNIEILSPICFCCLRLAVLDDTDAAAAAESGLMVTEGAMTR